MVFAFGVGQGEWAWAVRQMRAATLKGGGGCVCGWGRGTDRGQLDCNSRHKCFTSFEFRGYAGSTGSALTNNKTFFGEWTSPRGRGSHPRTTTCFDC